MNENCLTLRGASQQGCHAQIRVCVSIYHVDALSVSFMLFFNAIQMNSNFKTLKK